jgi:Tol biopolymer transport system component
MNKQEQLQPKRVNVGRGTYVMLVIGGIMLLPGGLGAVYYQTTLSHQGPGGGFELFFLDIFVVFPLFAIGGTLFLIGLIRLAKQMPMRSRVITSLVGVGLIVGLPVIGGVIGQSPLFLGPYPLFTHVHSGGGVLSVVWSPDGRHIASNYGDGTVQVWDAISGSTISTYRSEDIGLAYDAPGVAWSPDGKRIASSHGGLVQVWDAATGNLKVTYRGHSDVVTSVAWSPDGKRIASGSDDGTMQMWDAANGSHVYTYRGRDFGSPAANDVTGVAWSPDGKRIASSQGGSVVVWDAISGSTISTYQGHSIFTRMAWSPDGRRIAAADSYYGYVEVWDAASGSTISTYQHYYGGATTLAWSPDGKRIAAGYVDGAVRIWDAS